MFSFQASGPSSKEFVLCFKIHAHASCHVENTVIFLLNTTTERLLRGSSRWLKKRVIAWVESGRASTCLWDCLTSTCSLYFCIYYIPNNYVIPWAMPHAIPQTHSAFYPHWCRMTKRNKLNWKLRPFLARQSCSRFFNVAGSTTMTKDSFISHGRLPFFAQPQRFYLPLLVGLHGYFHCASPKERRE